MAFSGKDKFSGPAKAHAMLYITLTRKTAREREGQETSKFWLAPALESLAITIEYRNETFGIERSEYFWGATRAGV